MNRRDQHERFDGMCDAHASIVMPDGSVGGIDRSPSPFWNNSASTGREYGADKTGEPHIPASPATGDAPLERSGAAATASGVDLTPGGRVFPKPHLRKSGDIWACRVGDWCGLSAIPKDAQQLAVEAWLVARVGQGARARG